MKTYAYLILAVLVCSILVQPLVEVALVCKDRVEVGAAITNSVRAAKKECYSYYGIRDLNADADKTAFMETFAQTFGESLKLDLMYISGDTMVFQPRNNKYNTFRVDCTFIPSYYGDRRQTRICIESTSEYKFKTKYLRDAQDIIKANSGTYKLNHRRWYNLNVTN